MNFSQLTIAACVGLAAAGAVQAAPASDSTGFYVGGTLGRADLSEKSGGVDAALAAQGITGDSSVKKDATSYGLNLGYQFNRYLAVEGGVSTLGKHSVSGSISSPVSDGLSGDVKTRLFDVAAVGTLPLDNGFSLFGKAGVAYSELKLDASASSGSIAINDRTERRYSPLLGVGAAYAITQNVDATLEFDRIDRLGTAGSTGRFDSNQLLAGVRVRL